MNNLPEPMVPSDCDIRELRGMQLDIPRLMQSKTWLRAGRVPFLAFRVINLWTRAFHECPAGSIENDPDVLCDAAKCPPAEWEAASADVLRGWVPCSDGRIYHPVVVEVVMELWASRLKFRHSKAIERAKKAWLRKGKIGDEPVMELLPWLKNEAPASHAMADRIFRGGDLGGWAPRAVTSKTSPSAGQSQLSDGQTEDKANCPTDIPGTSAGQSQLSDGKRSLRYSSEGISSEGYSVVPKGTTGASAADPWAEVYAYGRKLLGSNAGGIITNLRKTFDDKPRKVMAKLQDAADHREPVVWINAFLWKHGPDGIEVQGGVSV